MNIEKARPKTKKKKKTRKEEEETNWMAEQIQV